MKKLTLIALTLVLILSGFTPLHAELKIGFVNTQRIMQEWDEAREAQKKLDEKSKELQSEYQDMLGRLDSMNQTFEKQKMMMSDERRQQKEQEIMQFRQQVQQYQMQKLGPQGEIYQIQQELTQPVLEKIQKVIQQIGDDNNYDYILDSVSGNILYAAQAHDLTDKVIYQLNRSE
ncbi:MAG: OmpH family outer membrane protein [Candidatus Marinimicrobia bacterium]|nr:OmpH family outer membrane protein [Candidatus Neomarinimicrobiota bacterium]